MERNVKTWAIITHKSSPSQRRSAPFRALARARVLILPGYLHPGKGKERKALAKSKVRQWSRARDYSSWAWTSSLISKIWLFARGGLSKISIFRSIYLKNHVSRNELWNNFCWKKWEELIYYGKSWNIGQVCFEFLMFMNFVALYNLLRKTCAAFLFNEAVSFLNCPV